MIRVITFFCILSILSSCNENKSTTKDQEVQYIDPAIEGISQLINADSTNADLRYKRAQLLSDRELYSQSIEDLEFAIKQDSLQPDYYHLLADNYLDYYRSRDAIKILNTCLLRFPGRLETLLKLSEFYFILRQTDHSLNTLNFIIKDHPQNAEAFYMLGMNFREMEDEERAANSFQRAVELDATLTDGWLELGKIYTERGDPQALQYYKNGKLSDPKSPIAIHALAFYLQEHGQEEAALAEYDELILLDRNYTAAYLNAGILQLERDSFRLAFEHFKILAELEPSNPKAHFYKGITYESIGDTSQARMSYQNALNLDPAYENASTQLAKLTM